MLDCRKTLPEEWGSLTKKFDERQRRRGKAEARSEVRRRRGAERSSRFVFLFVEERGFWVMQNQNDFRILVILGFWELKWIKIFNVRHDIGL